MQIHYRPEGSDAARTVRIVEYRVKKSTSQLAGCKNARRIIYEISVSTEESWPDGPSRFPFPSSFPLRPARFAVSMRHTSRSGRASLILVKRCQPITWIVVFLKLTIARPISIPHGKKHIYDIFSIYIFRWMIYLFTDTVAFVRKRL